MSEAKVIFNFNEFNTTILCSLNEKLKNIIERFCSKAQIDINKIYFLYNGNMINKELKFEEVANQVDKKSRTMNIIGYEINNNKEEIKENINISKDIICPECKENALIKIENYKIKLYNCKNGHNIDNITIREFDEKQKIDISKIVCNNCNENNKVRHIIMNFINV